MRTGSGETPTAVVVGYGVGSAVVAVAVADSGRHDSGTAGIVVGVDPVVAADGTMMSVVVETATAGSMVVSLNNSDSAGS